MKSKQSWLVIASVFAFVILGGTIASYFIRGYRPDISRGILIPTGLLAANSTPKGASVYIDGKLVTATDDTLNLVPGQYEVKIVKDGYLPWQKTITIKKEVVKQTEANLFRAAPDLKPITDTGAQNPILSPQGNKVVYAVSNASLATKNGLWVSELASNGISLIKSSAKHLAHNQANLDWSKAKLTWSPNGQNILAQFKADDQVISSYLLAADRLTGPDQLRDVTFRLSAIFADWERERQKELALKMLLLPEELQAIASQSATWLTFSPDEKRLFYLATNEAEIPQDLAPHPPARSDQQETRRLVPGNIYVYDLLEDTNFFIVKAEDINLDWQKLKPMPTPTPKKETTTGSPKPETVNYPLTAIDFQFPFYWLATSRHLVYIQEEKINVVEADSTNRQTLYAGPFENGFVFPWPDGSKLVILTSLHSDSPANLYAVTIR